MFVCYIWARTPETIDISFPVLLTYMSSEKYFNSIYLNDLVYMIQSQIMFTRFTPQMCFYLFSVLFVLFVKSSWKSPVYYKHKRKTVLSVLLVIYHDFYLCVAVKKSIDFVTKTFTTKMIFTKSLPMGQCIRITNIIPISLNKHR